METVPFSAMYDHVLPYLPAAEPPIVDSQMRKIVREFMKRTTLFRETFEFATEAGTDVYRLTPTFGQVSSVIEVRFPGRLPLPVVTEERRILPATPAEPRGWSTTLPDLLTLHPVPDAAYTLRCTGVLTLKQDDTEIPAAIVEHHAEAVAAGVLAAMFGMPGKPWTQSQSSKESGRVFNGVIRTIRGQLRDGGQPNQSTFRGIARFGA